MENNDILIRYFISFLMVFIFKINLFLYFILHNLFAILKLFYFKIQQFSSKVINKFTINLQ
jgi:hypothetical protein